MWKMVIVIMGLLSMLLSNATHVSGDEVHLLWDVPFDIGAEEAMRSMEEQKGISFNDPSIGLFYEADFSGEHMGQPVDRIEINKGYNGEYKSAEVYYGPFVLNYSRTAKQVYGECVDILHSLYGEMEKSFGESSRTMFTIWDENSYTKVTEINDFREEVTPEICAKVVYEGNLTLGIIAKFDNVLLNGYVFPRNDYVDFYISISYINVAALTE